jgi:hypothetical protein
MCQVVREKWPIFETLKPPNSSSFPYLKFYWTGPLKIYRSNNPGSELQKRQFPKLLDETWLKTGAPGFALDALKSAWIYTLIQMTY